MRGEEVVAPIDQRAQRLLARQSRPIAARQQTEAIRQALRNALDGQRAHAGRRKLDRERYAVEAMADVDDEDRVLLGQAKARLRGARPIHEKRYRREIAQCGRRHLHLRVGDGKRRQRIRGFARNVQRLATRRENLQLRPCLQQLAARLGARLQEMLAVVQDDQQTAVPDRFCQRFQNGVSGLFLDSQNGCDGLRDHPGIGDRRELDQPNAVGVIVQHVGGRLQGQPRLAQAARAKQRHQPPFLQRAPDFGQLALTTDERGHLLRQVVRRRGERTQRREILP